MLAIFVVESKIHDYSYYLSFIQKEKYMKHTAKSLLLLLHFWFPIALGWSISLIMHRATGLPIDSLGMYLFLNGICAAYSLDRLLDFPKKQPSWLWYVLLSGFVFSTTIGLIVSINLSLKTLSVVVALSLVSLLYRYFKPYPLVKTLLVSIIWVWAGAALPIHNNYWLAWNWWSYNISLPLFLLISAGCILCDLKDVESDSQKGVRSLPVMLGVSYTIAIVSFLCIVAAILSFYQHRYGIFVSSFVLTCLAWHPSVLSKEALGPLLVDVTLALPGILIFTRLV